MRPPPRLPVRLVAVDPVVAVALSALFGWWAATVGALKGRSKLEGWILGLFLGPIGVVIAYLLRPSR